MAPLTSANLARKLRKRCREQSLKWIEMRSRVSARHSHLFNIFGRTERKFNYSAIECGILPRSCKTATFAAIPICTSFGASGIKIRLPDDASPWRFFLLHPERAFYSHRSRSTESSRDAVPPLLRRDVLFICTSYKFTLPGGVKTLRIKLRVVDERFSWLERRARARSTSPRCSFSAV